MWLIVRAVRLYRESSVRGISLHGWNLRGRFWFEFTHTERKSSSICRHPTRASDLHVTFRQSLLRDSPNSKSFTSSFATVAKKQTKHNTGVLNRVCHYTRRKLGSCIPNTKASPILMNVFGITERTQFCQFYQIL